MEILKLLRGKHFTCDGAFYSCNIFEEIVSLTQSGFDVNALTDIGMTLLHFAITRGLSGLVLELIEHGADINLPDGHFEATPLHQAVRVRNAEIVSMLLCYGADVTNVDCEGMTPLMSAIDMGETDIARTLFDFYDDFTQVNKCNNDCLLLAAKMRNPIAIDIFKSNCCVTDIHRNTFIFSLLYDDAEFFKLIWFEHRELVLEVETPFLLQYLRLSHFKKDEWVECLYLILTCPFAGELIDNYRCYLEFNTECDNTPLFKYLYLGFNKLQVDLHDRLKIMCLCLSLGAVPDFKELAIVYDSYNFTEELEMLIYAGGSLNCFSNIENLNELIILYILGMESACSKAQDKLIFDCLKEQLVKWNEDRAIINFLKYVFVPHNVKQSLIATSLIVEHMFDVRPVINAIENFPTCPSLLSLARNTVRSFVRRPNDKPYQFFDRVNRLVLPKYLKNIVCFTEPVYRLN